MGLKTLSLKVQDLATEFNCSIVGKSDDSILYPGSVKKHNKNSISWIKNKDNFQNIREGYAIVTEKDFEKASRPSVTYLVTKEKAKLIFSKIVNKYFAEEEDVFTNYFGDHLKNKKIRIADNVFIGKNVEIGDGTVIHPNVVIHSNTKIGKNCIIRTHVSLATEGLGLEFDEGSDEYVRFPQLGGVVIEDDVEIGPCSTVRRSALDDTIIGRGTKIGSLVNIGHNCIIGKNCILTCQIVTSGSSVVGDNVFMGVNSILKNGINIGSNCTIGQGAVITKNVPDNSTYVGNPAESIEEYKIWSKMKKKLIQMFSDK